RFKRDRIATAPNVEKMRRRESRSPRRRPGSVAGIGAGLPAVDVAAIAAVPRRRQEGEFLGDPFPRPAGAVFWRPPESGAAAAPGPVARAGAGRVGHVIDAVADARGGELRAADDAQHDVGHVVVRPPAVGEAGGIAAEDAAEAALVLGRGRRFADIQAQQLSAGLAAHALAGDELTRIFEHQLHQVGARRRRNVDAGEQVESGGDRRRAVEVLELRLVLRLRRVPAILERRIDDELVDQRVGETRDLGVDAEFVRDAGLVEYADLLAARAGVDADHGVGGAVGSGLVAGDGADRQLDGYRIDVEAAEAVVAEGIGIIVGILGGAQERQRLAAQVDGVEHGAEIDIEGLVALAGEDADVAVLIDALRGQVLIVRYRAGAGVGGDGHERPARGPLHVRQ